jgi:hypothetical protein
VNFFVIVDRTTCTRWEVSVERSELEEDERKLEVYLQSLTVLGWMLESFLP